MTGLTYPPTESISKTLLSKKQFHLQNIHLDDYLNTTQELRFITAFTDVFIYPKQGRTKFVYETLKNATANSNLRRIGEPEEIGGAAVFLASKAGSFMTGQTVVIDGGR